MSLEIRETDQLGQMTEQLSFIAYEQSKRSRRHIQRVKLEDFTFQNLMNIQISTAGSRADGSNDDKSDTDLILVVNDIIAVERFIMGERANTKEKIEVLHVEEGNCHPGYCKLKYLMENRDSDKRGYFFKACCDKNGYISSTKFLNYAMTQVPGFFKKFGGHIKNIGNTNGPCITPSHTFGRGQTPSDIDFAFCIRCRGWPAAAKEWLVRERTSDWPDGVLMKEVRSTCCSFVPIGFSEEDSQRSLEWRYSFTVAEKLLTWSFNGTQLLCLDVLKLLHSTFVEPRYPKLLCSYFLKTLMFWLIESTPQNFWNAENFFVCFHRCLKKLKDCMQAVMCPHYFIRKNNMFDKKDKAILQQAVNLINSIDLHIFLKHFVNMKSIFFKRNIVFQNHISISTITFCRHLAHSALENVDEQSIVEVLAKFGKFNTDISNDHSDVMQGLMSTFSSSRGSAFLSEMKVKRCEMSEQDQQDVFTLLEEGTKSDAMAGYLKLATVLLYYGRIDKALLIIGQTEKTNIRRIVHYSFYSRYFVKEPDDETHPVDDKTPLSDVMGRFIALDIIFLPSEIFLVPAFVKYQLLDGRALFVSPILYRHCLEFECYNAKSDVVSMIKVYSKFCECRELFPSGGEPHIDCDLKAYFDIVLGNFGRAYHFLKVSIGSMKSGPASIWMLSMLLQKYLKTTH